MKSEDTDGIIDLGDPQRMVGHTGFTRHAGGGECSGCHQVFASLDDDGHCYRCSTAPTAVEPPAGESCGTRNRRR